MIVFHFTFQYKCHYTSALSIKATYFSCMVLHIYYYLSLHGQQNGSIFQYLLYHLHGLLACHCHRIFVYCASPLLIFILGLLLLLSSPTNMLPGCTIQNKCCVVKALLYTLTMFGNKRYRTCVNYGGKNFKVECFQ